MRQSMKLVNPLTQKGWEGAFAESPDFTIFHTGAWARVLAEAYGYQPFFCLLDDRQDGSALLPLMEVRSHLTGNRAVSLPFSDQVEPILGGTISFEPLWKSVKELSNTKGWEYVELRGGRTYLTDSPAYLSYYVHALDLKGKEDELFHALRDSTRRNIAKARREGVEVGPDNSLEAVRTFYELNCLTRKGHGLPPQPFTFFIKVWQHIIRPGKGSVILARFKKKPVAAAVFFVEREKALFKYGASDGAFQHLRANNLVMWEGIRWCRAQGCSTFSFGRTEVDNVGLRQFKHGWAPLESLIHYYHYDVKGDAFTPRPAQRGFIYEWLFTRLPIPLLQWLGRLFYKHIG